MTLRSYLAGYLFSPWFYSYGFLVLLPIMYNG